MKSLGFDHDRDRGRDAFDRHLAWLRSVGCQPMIDQLGHLLKRMRIIEAASDDQIFDRFFRFWAEAVSLQFSQSVFTMEDQKYGAARVIEASMERGQSPQGGSKYTDVLVDEFQDINPLDLRMIKDIIDYHRASLTIVGDDDQTIYEWRGATPEFILHPESAFGRPFQTHILQNNYRCPRNIVEHSKQLIAHNHRRVAKQINARSQDEAEVRIVKNPDFAGTVEEITALAQDFLEYDARSGKRLALIARKRAQLIPYQIVFASLDIPFCAAEDLQVFLNEAFKQLRAIIDIRAAAQGRQRTRDMIDAAMVLLDKIKRYPLSKQEKGKIELHLSRARPRDWDELIAALESYDGPFKKMTGQEAAAMLAVSCGSIRCFLRSETVARALDCLSSDFAGFDKDYGKSKEELFYADPPFFYLSRFSEKYGADFDAFLEDVDRAIETLVQLPSDEDSTDEIWARPIHLMTALRAKGREFGHVVLLDVNDGIWPARQAETPAQYEQERRVFYVAMTRAKESLWLTVSGSIGGDVATPSRYIEEAGFEATTPSRMIIDASLAKTV